MIHTKLPNARLLVLGIFPRGSDPANPRVKADREKIKTVNEGLAKLDDGGRTRYLDIGGHFLDADESSPRRSCLTPFIRTKKAIRSGQPPCNR